MTAIFKFVGPPPNVAGGYIVPAYAVDAETVTADKALGKVWIGRFVDPAMLPPGTVGPGQAAVRMPG